MGLDSNAVADTTGTQVVRLMHIFKRLDNLHYFLFGFSWEGTFGQFTDTRLKQLISYLHQHQAYDDGGYRVEDSPALAKPDGQAYT